jgi:hypothetical protein
MRIYTVACAVVGLALLVVAGTPGREPSKKSDNQRVARLIRQLGDDEFAKREAASKELETIGAPAMGALRKAAASGDDLEIRRRSKQLVQAIAGRLRKTSISGRWTGYGVNSLGQQSPGEMVITEEPDGTLTGKWGAPMHLTIENGERLTEDTLQWQGSNGQGTYRARCAQRGNSLVIDWTYAEDGKGPSQTGTIVYARK